MLVPSTFTGCREDNDEAEILATREIARPHGDDGQRAGAASFGAAEFGAAEDILRWEVSTSGMVAISYTQARERSEEARSEV